MGRSSTVYLPWGKLESCGWEVWTKGEPGQANSSLLDDRQGIKFP